MKLLTRLLIPAALLLLHPELRTATAQPFEPFPPSPRTAIVQVTRSVTPAPSCSYCSYSYPAEVTEWRDAAGVLHTGSGWFYSYPRAVNTPTRWTPRQAVWIEQADGNAAWWVLQWAEPGWVWTHPDDVAIRPFYRTVATGGFPFAFITYNVPNGRRFPAHAITTSPAGTCVGCNTTPVTFESKYGQLGGSVNTHRYEAAEYPLVFGSCVASNQPSGAPGSFYGFWGDTPPFAGATFDDWRTGIFVIGPSPYRPADFNRDGTVTVQDIFDFVAAYLAGSPRADCDHSGACDAGDVFAFISEWFTS